MFGTWRFFDTVKREGPRLSAVVIALGALYLIVSSGSATAAPLGAPAPDITAISPGEGYNSQPTDVTIAGLNFTATPTVTLGIMPLTHVGFVSGTTLTATVPADLPGGTYDLTVTNPDGQSASLPSAFEVHYSSDGRLVSWQTSTSMTTKRNWPAAVAVQGYLYVSGGGPLEWITPVNSVEWAPINGDDGLLGQWQTTSPMNAARSAHAMVHASGFLYALGGGWENDKSVERARINTDGSLGAWHTMTSMSTCGGPVAAVATTGYVYAIGGGHAGDAVRSVERAKINPDGSLGIWESMASMNEARQFHAAVVVGSYVYAIGGQSHVAPSLRTVERARINRDGALGSWESVASMNDGRCNLGAETARGYIYAIGGSTCTGADYDSVERATVRTDGSLDPWEYVSSMAGEREQLAAAQWGPYIYAVGGDSGAGILNSVERAEIGSGMVPTGHGVSINDGALFTNRVTVRLTIGYEPDTTEMQVSNDGGFAGAAWEPFAQEKTWQITRYGDYVIPRVVYVRYKGYHGNVSSTYQDDIILDVNAPTGSVNAVPGVSGNGLDGPSVGAPTDSGGIKAADDSHTVYLPAALRCYPHLPTGPANVTLELSATDDVSGVADMMISNRADFFCESWETYATSKGWYVPSGTTTIYVKFRDNAGNVSDVATDTITR